MGGRSGVGPGRGWGGGDLRGAVSRGSGGPGGVARVWRWARAGTDGGSGWVRGPSPVREGAGWAGEGRVLGVGPPHNPAPPGPTGSVRSSRSRSPGVGAAGRRWRGTQGHRRPPARPQHVEAGPEPGAPGRAPRGGGRPAGGCAARHRPRRRSGEGAHGGTERGRRGSGRVTRVGMRAAEAWPRSGGGAQVGRAGEARAARPVNFPRLVRARPLCPVVTAPLHITSD